MRRFHLLTLFAALVFLATACSGGSTPSDTPVDEIGTPTTSAPDPDEASPADPQPEETETEETVPVLAEEADQETETAESDVVEAESNRAVDETVITPNGPVDVFHDFESEVDGPEACFPGVYDIIDDDVQKWFDVFLGYNSMGSGAPPLELDIASGSGGTFEFTEEGRVILTTVIDATFDSEVGQGTMTGSGTNAGTYDHQVDPEDPNAMYMLLNEPDIDVTVSIGGISMNSREMGLGSDESIVLDNTIRYECYNTGLLSIYWPTDGGYDGPAPIFDMVKR